MYHMILLGHNEHVKASVVYISYIDGGGWVGSLRQPSCLESSTVGFRTQGGHWGVVWYPECQLINAPSVS